MTAHAPPPSSQHERLAAAIAALDQAGLPFELQGPIEAVLLDYQRIVTTGMIDPEPVAPWFPAGVLEEPPT
jgi:hypothetical protein